MTSYKKTFMGNAGFDELRRYTRQATDFGREIVNILNERAQVEQNYAKSLRRLGQRVSKATSLAIGSPLTNAWKTVGVEMEKEADMHRDLGCRLIEDCVQPLSMLTEGQLKPRRMMEQRVEASSKTWTDRYADHVKMKRRFHAVTRENEALVDQIDGMGARTEKDQQKLYTKQTKQVDTVHQADSQYYNSLLQLERSRQDWESASYECCAAAEDMDTDRFAKLSHVIRKYADNVYEIPSKMKTMCRIIDEATDELSTSKEIAIVSEKLRGGPYVSEQLLCDYYQENFSCPMSIERRRASINKLLSRYINDLQKERSHHDGLIRLDERTNDTDLSVKLSQSSAMFVFFDVIRYKLNCTLASLDGHAQPSHPLSNNVEHNSDKQGIMFSTLKLKPGEADEKMKNSSKSSSRSSKPKSASKNHVSSSHSNSSSSSHKSKSDHHRSSSDRKMSTPSVDGRKHGSSPSSHDYKKSSSQSPKEHLPREKEHPSSSVTPINSNGTNEQPEVLCRCVAIYDYAATREDELSIREGEVINVYEKGADDWWKGELNGKVGLFPANYVDIEISV